MSKIPTAEEFLEDFDYKNQELGTDINYPMIERCMVEFTKLHVELALKAKIQAMEKYMNDDYSLDEIDAFTYNAYPLNLVK